MLLRQENVRVNGTVPLTRVNSHAAYRQGRTDQRSLGQTTFVRVMQSCARNAELFSAFCTSNSC